MSHIKFVNSLSQQHPLRSTTKSGPETNSASAAIVCLRNRFRAFKSRSKMNKALDHLNTRDRNDRCSYTALPYR